MRRPSASQSEWMSNFTDSRLAGEPPRVSPRLALVTSSRPISEGLVPSGAEVRHEHRRRIEAEHVPADERVVAEVGEVALAQRRDGDAVDRVGQVAGEVVVERPDGHVHRVEEVVRVHADLLAADGHDRVAVVGPAVGEEERLRFGIRIVQVQREDQVSRIGARRSTGALNTTKSGSPSWFGIEEDVVLARECADRALTCPRVHGEDVHERILARVRAEVRRDREGLHADGPQVDDRRVGPASGLGQDRALPDPGVGVDGAGPDARVRQRDVGGRESGEGPVRDRACRRRRWPAPRRCRTAAAGHARRGATGRHCRLRSPVLLRLR